MEPHAHITTYYGSDTEKRRFLDALFGRAAVHYDRTSQLLSMGSGRFYRRFVLTRAGQRVAGWYLGRALPRLTRLATRSDDAELMMRYYWQTIANCVSPDTILTTMRHAGFRDVHRTVYFGMCSEYYGTKA